MYLNIVKVFLYILVSVLP